MKNAFPKKKKQIGPYLLAFFIPIFILLIVYIERGLWPFGERCILRIDLYHQYAPFLKELRTKMTTGGSLLYSWNIGGGTNFWTMAAYYLANPTNLLVALFPKANVIEFVTVDITLKTALCSVAMTYYLNKRHEKKGLDGYLGVFFGIFYAFSGYMAAYYWNIMWLDSLWIFPLVILGMDQLFREERGLLYGVALAYAVFSNYYIGFMICVGVVIYFLFLLGTEPLVYHHFFKKLLKIIGYSILALMVSAAFLLPYIHYFSMTASANSTFTWEWRSYFSVFEMMARQLMNVPSHTGLDHWPNIYAGVAIFLCIPFYFLNRKISFREKIGYTILMIFFYFSFSTRAMDYMWHVFHIPNSLPCRQAFIFVFFLLVMSYRGFLGVKDRPAKEISLVMVLAVGFIFLLEYFVGKENSWGIEIFYLSAIFIILYAIWFYGFRKGKLYGDVLLTLLLALAIVEACVNTSVISVSTVNRTEYTAQDETLAEMLDEIEKEEGGRFYRVEKTDNRTKNDGAWHNYHSVSTFSSAANYNLTAFYKKLGLESSTNAYSSNGQTPFTNMLQGVKYSVSSTELPENENLYQPYADDGNKVYVYKNNYVLPLGFMLDAEVADTWETSGKTPLDNQNLLAELVSSEKDLFVCEMADGFGTSSVSYRVETPGLYYAYSTTSGPKEITVDHDSFTKKFENLGRSYTMVLGYCEAGEEIRFSNAEEDSVKSMSISVYRLDETKMKKVYEAFSENVMEVDSYTDTSVKAHIDVKKDGELWTTIPAEEGWELFVDGEKVAYETIKDTYIKVALKKGAHTLAWAFHVPWLSWSSMITALGLLIFIVLFIVGRVKKKKEEEKINALLCQQSEIDGEVLMTETLDDHNEDAVLESIEETVEDIALEEAEEAVASERAEVKKAEMYIDILDLDENESGK